MRRFFLGGILAAFLVVATLPGGAFAGDPERYADRSDWPDWAVEYAFGDRHRKYPTDGELVDAIKFELIRGYPVKATDRYSYEDREFRFSATMTRAEFATVLSRSLALAQDGAGSSWYAPHVAVLQARDVIPADASTAWSTAISRREAGQWMGRAAEAFGADSDRDSRTFVDVADPEIARAIRAGIVQGTGEGRYEPDRALIRGEAAVMLLRLARAMNSDVGDIDAVMSELKAVLIEADTQEMAYHKRRTAQGYGDPVDTGGVRTREQADRWEFLDIKGRDASGRAPNGWYELEFHTLKIQPLQVGGRPDIHDSIATIEGCVSGTTFYREDLGYPPEYTTGCGRQYFVRRDGQWVISAAGTLVDQSLLERSRP